MSKRTFYQSILEAKTNSTHQQSINLFVEPDNEWIQNSPHKFDGKAEIFGVLKYDDNHIIADLSFKVPMNFLCDRCATSFNSSLVYKESFIYEELVENLDLSEIEIEYKIISNRIDLVPALRDSILENLPSQVLCKDDCKGLCPICGENLNFSQCRCKM